MFWKSLQLKLILIFFILIATTLLAIGTYSINTTEKVYYNGFVQEMLNTISSFGLNIENIKEEENKAKADGDGVFSVGQDFFSRINDIEIYKE